MFLFITFFTVADDFNLRISPEDTFFAKNDEVNRNDEIFQDHLDKFTLLLSTNNFKRKGRNLDRLLI